jgi:peptidoglycan/LPS O-acetylase OafA/YrhL
MHKKAASVEYHPSLDIVRGIAVTMVILYHVFWYVSFFRLGWIGVDLFFVLSGYLIITYFLSNNQTLLLLPLIVSQKSSISLIRLLIIVLLSIASFNIIEKRFLSLKKYLHYYSSEKFYVFAS